MYTHKFDPKTIDVMKVSELNNLIGGGQPKYSNNQLKSLKKSALQDEAMTLWHEWLSDNPIKKERVAGERKGAVEKVSKNRDVAASKKCNNIKALIAGTKTLEQVQATYEMDTVLQDYWPIDKYKADIALALKGERPRTKLMQLAMELEDV